MDILSLPVETLRWLIAIVTCTVGAIICVLYLKLRGKFTTSRRIVEYLPTFISTLGVFGTFWGITTGLMDFDTANLDESIPGLLNGLKTAFYTSLAGLIGSAILSFLVNGAQDKEDNGVSDIDQAAGSICESVKQMSDANKETLQSLKTMFEEQEKDRKAFYRSVGDLLDKVSSSQSSISTAIQSIETSQSSLKAAADTMVVLARSQESSTAKVQEQVSLVIDNTSVLKTVDANIAEVLDAVSAINNTQNEMNTQVQNLKEILHGEVLQIEQSMDKTSELLERKFNEFTELLKKSNTEALVEVMTRVTEEFQKQMNSLISKLIQENFDQLNKSVEQLNVWQQENKEMITSLTNQYKQMADNFDATADSLGKVKDDTESLVSESGKLRQIVDALNKVLVEDERFLDVTQKLQDTAGLTMANMEKFDESTKVLNDWVRKQRNFVDAVAKLIDKLDELNKIRDYGEEFWKDTKRKMEEGVGIISSTTNKLNNNLVNIDQSFYRRLSTTLGELDNCITKMVETLANRR